MVRRELAPSRSAARELIEAGRVLVGGSIAAKVARLVAPGDPIVLSGDPPKYVSRGGWKLEAALDAFGIDVEGRCVLDAGASTGGFTDCVLQRGAAHVVAVDVGHGQLHERIRADARADVRERINVRHMGPDDLARQVDLVVADLSFISLRTVLANLRSFLVPGGEMVTLVKPQFEAGRTEASRGRGVIRDEAVWRRVLVEVIDAASSLELGIMGLMISPIQGADGNTEFLLHTRLRDATADGSGVVAASPHGVAKLIDDAVASGAGSGPSGVRS